MQTINLGSGGNLPRRAVKILKASIGEIALETTTGLDYRFSIPKAIRNLMHPEETVKITIKRVEEVRN